MRDRFECIGIVVEIREGAFHEPQFAKCPARDALLHERPLRMVRHHERLATDETRRIAQRDQLPNLRSRHGDGLFAQHMLAGEKRFLHHSK